MKNLKEEIEEMIMQYSKELLTIRDTHNVPWLLNECTKASNVFAEALTPLIEQESERAVEEFHNFVRSNTIGGRFMDDSGGYFNADAVLREDIEQYLAERRG